MLQELKTANKVVGIKQLRRALREGTARRIFLADNADPCLTDPIRTEADALGVPVVTVPTMEELGKACAIPVKAAAAAILN